MPADKTSSGAMGRKDVAEQTIDGTLPYEETWLENARNVVELEAMLDDAKKLLLAAYHEPSDLSDECMVPGSRATHT